jgi:hypothetical protein
MADCVVSKVAGGTVTASRLLPKLLPKLKRTLASVRRKDAHIMSVGFFCISGFFL